MNFFNKNLLACLQLIIFFLLLALIPTVDGMGDDMSRVNYFREVAKNGADPIPAAPFNKLQKQSSSLLSQSSSSSSSSSSFNYQQDLYGPSPIVVQPVPLRPAISLQWPEVTRVYRLYNRRSSRDLLVADDKVSATGSVFDEKGDLGLESVIKLNVVRTRIRGISNDKYLCFNQRGRLVLKPKKKATGDKCEFIEETTDSGSRFGSAFNTRWHLGFTTKGQPLNGAAYDTHQTSPFAASTCFLFYKTSLFPKDKYPDNFTKHNFDPIRHNQAIGQVHPGLSPEEFLPEFIFPGKSKPEQLAGAPSRNTNTSNSAPHAHRHRHLSRQNRKNRRVNRTNKEQKTRTTSLNDNDKQSVVGQDDIPNSKSPNSRLVDDVGSSISSNSNSRLINYGQQWLYNENNLQLSSHPLFRSLPYIHQQQQQQQSESESMTKFNSTGPTSTSTSTPSPPPRSIPRLRRLKKSQRNHSKSTTTISSSRINSDYVHKAPSKTTTTTTTPPAPFVHSTAHPTISFLSKPKPKSRRHHRRQDPTSSPTFVPTSLPPVLSKLARLKR